MAKPEITYSLHDSTLVAVSTGLRKEATLVVDLYPIFYPDKPRIVLRFGGIENLKDVCEYLGKIEPEAGDDYIGCRIDCFQYDTEHEPSSSGYWFLLDTDWYGSLRIHCSKMTMERVSGRDSSRDPVA